jgi:hypothetical protein
MNVAREKFGPYLDTGATFFIVSCGLMLCVILPARAAAQNTSSAVPSVVEAAKQKASDKKAKRVYTDDDFPKSEPIDPKKDQAGPDEAKSEGGAAETPAAVDAGGESAEIKQARKVVETRQIQIDTLMEEKTALESRLHEGTRSSDEAAAISESIRNLEQKLSTLKKEHDDAQKAIDASSKPKPQDQN